MIQLKVVERRTPMGTVFRDVIGPGGITVMTDTPPGLWLLHCLDRIRALEAENAKLRQDAAAATRVPAGAVAGKGKGR